MLPTRRTTPRGGPALIVLAACACLLAPAAAPAQGPPDWHRGTWPLITTSVTAYNGWVYAVGRTEGTYGYVVWYVPLAPEGGAVVIRHGISTTYVSVGPRQFVIDDTTGQTEELRNGQIYRRYGPQNGTTWSPPIRRPRPTAPSTEQPPAATGEAPGLQTLSRRQELLRRATEATEAYLSAQADLARLRNDRTTLPGKIEQAEQAVARTQERAMYARMRLEQQLRAPVPGVAMPTGGPFPQWPGLMEATEHLTSEQSQRLDKAQQQVVDLTEKLNDVQDKIDELRQAGGHETEIRALRPKALELRRQLGEANLNVRDLLLQGQVNRAADIDPSLRGQLQAAVQKILDLTALLRVSEEKMRSASTVAAAGGSRQQLQAAVNANLELMKKRTEAYNQLSALIDKAYEKAAPPATQPAGLSSR